MNFTADIFLNAILLLCYKKDADTIDLIQKIIESYNRDKNQSVSISGTALDIYIEILKELMSDEVDLHDKRALNTLLLKYKEYAAVQNDPELYTRLKEIILDDKQPTAEQIDNLYNKLTNILVMDDTLKIVKRMFGRLSNAVAASSAAKQNDILKEIRDLSAEIIEKHDNATIDDDDDMRTTFLDFTDKESIKKACQVYENVAVKGMMKTGLQGMNLALGGGFKIGESIVFNALSHEGKSLSLLKFVRWQVTLNSFPLEVKNPTVILYSLENEVSQNLKLLYDELYINKYKQPPEPNTPIDKVVDFCFDEFTSRGWRLIVQRRIGAEFGFAQLVADFEDYVRRGFTPMMVVIDYMDMMAKGGVLDDDSGSNHLLIKQLYTNMCNFLKSRNCTLVTAHQLNRKAAESVRNNPVGAVKRFGIDMLSGSMDPQREVDVVFYQHIEQNAQGVPFMTYKLDKHRYEHNVPEKYKCFAYEFEGSLGILDDVESENKCIYNIYAKAKNAKNDEDDDNIDIV